MSELNLDRARVKRIRARVGRAASYKYRFFQGGNPYPINGLAFEWFLKDHKDLPTKLIKLTTANELVIEGASLNELVVPMTEANAIKMRPHAYHCELVCTTRVETWFVHPFIAHNGEFDAGTDTDEITTQINLGNVTVDVSITISDLSAASIASALGYTPSKQIIQLAASDETTALTVGVNKITFRMPHAMTLSAVRASLSTAQATGLILTIDINKNGVSILSTKLTIDNTEKTSLTAVTAPVISDNVLPDDAEITVDIDQVGDGTAKGLKILLIGS